MSKASLKKAMKGLSREEIIELICDLYDARPEAKEYLEFWANPDADIEVEKYKARVFKIFFISEDKIRKRPDFAKLKMLLKYFSSLYIDPDKEADFRLYIIEAFSSWLRRCNTVMSHEQRSGKMQKELKEYLVSNNLEDRYGVRYEKVADELNSTFARGNLPNRRGWRRYIKF